MEITQRKQHIEKVFDFLEQTHLNLYHHISKEEFKKCQSKFAQTAEFLETEQFEAGMLRLFHLFFDAHTFYDVKFDSIRIPIVFHETKLFLISEGSCVEVTHVNGFAVNAVIEELKKLLSYEVVEEWTFWQLRKLIVSPKALRMIGMSHKDDSIVMRTVRGNDFVFEHTNKIENIQRTGNTQIASNKERRKYYCFECINGEVLYIRYTSCQEDEAYPFATFVEDIQKSCSYSTKACIVDVRNNPGGSDMVIKPLIKYLSDKQMPTYVLMNGRTFSSGTFAVADLKRYANATILGTPCGQPTKRYGQCKRVVVDDYVIGCSMKYFDFAAEKTECEDRCYYWDTFDYDGAIQPDVLIKQELDTYTDGIDYQLQKTIKYIENEML